MASRICPCCGQEVTHPIVFVPPVTKVAAKSNTTIVTQPATRIAYLSVINVQKELFTKTLIDVSNALHIHPSWLLIVIKIESNFNRRAVNKVSKATGLLQWIPRYVAIFLGLKTTQATEIQNRILRMSGAEQLELAQRFLMPYRGRMTDVFQTYLAVFYPRALGKPDNYVIGKRYGTNIERLTYKWNAYLDTKFGNNDGVLTVSDVKAFVRNSIPNNCDL